MQHIDGTGIGRRFAYDGERRCVADWFEDNLKSRALRFTKDGLLAVVADSYGFQTVYRLDDHRRVISSIDPMGRRFEWVYGPDGSLVSVVMPDGLPKEAATWDMSQRVLTVVDYEVVSHVMSEMSPTMPSPCTMPRGILCESNEIDPERFANSRALTVQIGCLSTMRFAVEGHQPRGVLDSPLRTRRGGPRVGSQRHARGIWI